MLFATTALTVFATIVAAQNAADANGTVTGNNTATPNTTVGGNETIAGNQTGMGNHTEGNHTVSVAPLILHSFLNETMTPEQFPKANTTEFNRVSIAGWRSQELTRAALSFNNYTAEQRKAIVDDYHNAHKLLRVSAFGANDNVTTDKKDPEELAQNLAKYANDYGLDGVDINYEDRAAVASGDALDWLNKFHSKLKSSLQPQAVITYSPIADFFANQNDTWVQFLSGVKEDVDWISIQFYNGGRFNYTTADQLFNDTGNPAFPSRARIAQLLGVDVNKIVVQKPLQENQPGFVPAVDLGKAFCERNVTFNGVSVWRIDYRNTSISNNFIKTLQNATSACGVLPNGTTVPPGTTSAPGTKPGSSAQRLVPAAGALVIVAAALLF